MWLVNLPQPMSEAEIANLVAAEIARARCHFNAANGRCDECAESQNRRSGLTLLWFQSYQSDIGLTI